MASTDKPADPETGKEVLPSKASCDDTPPPPKAVDLFAVDVALRFLVFAASLTSVLVIVTSKQTVFQGPIPFEAKFENSPAFM